MDVSVAKPPSGEQCLISSSLQVTQRPLAGPRADFWGCSEAWRAERTAVSPIPERKPMEADCPNSPQGSGPWATLQHPQQAPGTQHREPKRPQMEATQTHVLFPSMLSAEYSVKAAFWAGKGPARRVRSSWVFTLLVPTAGMSGSQPELRFRCKNTCVPPGILRWDLHHRAVQSSIREFRKQPSNKACSTAPGDKVESAGAGLA